jgi:hypothetical protein
VTVLNLTPLLDSLGGAGDASAASFRAVAMRAGRSAVRVQGPAVTFPTEITASWTAGAWDVNPQLYILPVDCYWTVRVAAAGTRLEGAYILPNGGEVVDFGDLIAVTPDTGQVDTGALAQYQATQQYVSNQVSYIDGVAATIFGQVATVQATIGTAASAAAAAAAAATAAQTAQTALQADLDNVNASTAAAAASATEAAGSASAAGGSASAAATSATSASSAAIATAADRAAITAAITDFYATTIDGND